MTDQTESKSSLTPNQISHIGDYLKAKRENAKIPLERISQRTKINLNILKALENNKFKNLPSAAYLKGFVLSYAKELGLDADEVLTKLEYSYLTFMGKSFPKLHRTNPHEGVHHSPDMTPLHQTPGEVLEEEIKQLERKKMILPVAIISSFVFIVVGIYKIVTKTIEQESQVLEKPVTPSEVSPVESATVTAEIDSPVKTDDLKEEEKLKITPETEKTAPVVVATTMAPPSPEPAPAPAPAPAPVPAPVPTPVPTPVPAPVPAISEVDTQVLNPANRIYPDKNFRRITRKLFAFKDSSPAIDALLSQEAIEKYQQELENIFIIASEGDTWLTYQIDDGKIRNASLKKDQGLFLQGKKVLIFFGNVKLTRVFYQNRLIDAPTPSGYKSLIFPEALTKTQLLPLFPRSNDNVVYTADEYVKRMKEEEEKLRN